MREEYDVLWRHLDEILRSNRETVKQLKTNVIHFYDHASLYATAVSPADFPDERDISNTHESDFLYFIYKCLTTIRDGMPIVCEQPMLDLIEYGDDHFYLFYQGLIYY